MDAKAEEKTPEKTPVQKKEMFETIIKHYLESNPAIKDNNKEKELEIRFGTNSKVARPISKIDYDNVVQHLYSNGFKTDNVYGHQMLRINNEYLDKNTGKKRISNVRAEINGSDLIQEYCKTNSLQKLINMPSTAFGEIKFTQKVPATTSSGQRIEKLDMEDFNLRVSYQNEQDYHPSTYLAREILSKWEDSLKLFRAMNRVRFYHDEYPIFFDLSIVRNSKKMNKVTVPKYTIQEAEVFNTVEHYEIEIEVNNAKVGINTEYNTVSKLANAIRKCIRIVLSGLQGTPYPISYNECNNILIEYMQLIHGPEYVPRKMQSKDFIGPSSYTLQMENIIENNENNNVANIRKNYTVTDKADGERKLLYISENGKIYMIDTNMNVVFTGMKTQQKEYFQSLLDGEHIKYDKHGKLLNMYAAFDIYIKKKKSTREFEFIKTSDAEREEEEEKESNEKKEEKLFRLDILYEFIRDLKSKSIVDNPNAEVSKNSNDKNLPILIKCKEFYQDNDVITIFEGCSKILSNEKDGLYEYNTDGLIFTPARLPVSGNSIGGPPGPLKKYTWDYSFKWKPPQYNTVDFLVSVKKDKTGKDEVHNVFQDGTNMQGLQNVIQYKTLILRCGFSEKKHGFLNPFNDMIQDILPNTDDIDNEDNYQPVPFQPTNPSDINASMCNIFLKEDGTKSYMTTEEGEYFEEDMIVEFKYEMNNEPKWRWKPIRVRYDKTAELRRGERNYGNAYHVANSNWHSIHHPITDEMISSGLNIPDIEENEDVYYNRTKKESSTQGLRDFHNLFVKLKLIQGVSNRGDTLIDYAVGMAGDLPKWIRSKLKFVFGIDISKDNIMNQLNGACARYLKATKKFHKIPNALFLHGNSGKNIRKGDAYYTDKDKQISKAVFGTGAKDPSIIGKGVYKNYGLAESGFQISSCQFALHYFFENEYSLHSFLRNISECTKVNGKFIGTCYDGKTVFNLLRNKKKDEGFTIFKNDRKIFELTKTYDQTGFPDDELSLGYGINVYQETINKVFREYLVNFEYFVRVMEDYGFVLITQEECVQMKLPEPTGMFRNLYDEMEKEIKIDKRKQADYKDAIFMSPEEKRISFMNRYFVFKKVRNVDAKKMESLLKKQSQLSEEYEVQSLQEKDDKENESKEEDSKKEKQDKDTDEPIKKPKIKKTKKKLMINEE
tara:strand:+ start:36 stop:3551 length:3516 start_codon:yes stop_codon:yes gene_type:complete